MGNKVEFSIVSATFYFLKQHYIFIGMFINYNTSICFKAL